eukprot:TRINITY_DN38557_c0_g1_i1.p1 TRINITY_DN38557_c0_g1~~TRINITY_DN38557_c0_g1_i1.p1  ORF type:complete len:293 (+),score=57.55 TRINITY_DN38557_c0_g1_i1:46-879(+)
MSWSNRFSRTFARINANAQNGFVRNMAATRGFIANPRLLTNAVRDWRTARRKSREQAWEKWKQDARLNGNDLKVQSWEEMWFQFCEGTEVVFRPLTNRYKRKRAWVVDRYRGFKSSLPSFKRAPAVKTEKPVNTAKPQAESTGTARSNFLVLVQDTGRAINRRTTALATHFKEFMLDPNFKRRQFIYHFRQWQPTTNIGRVMAPFGLAIAVFIPFAAIVWHTVGASIMEREHRSDLIKKAMLERSQPGSNLGLPAAEKAHRNEDDALLELYTVRRWR